MATQILTNPQGGQTYQNVMVNHTWTRMDPGEYTGPLNERGEREGLEATCTWSDGSKYVGGWKNGLRWGKGIFTSADGNFYEGMWVDDYREGPGVMTYTDGNNHASQLLDGAEDNDEEATPQ